MLHFGKCDSYYTVLFGVSRTIGVLSQVPHTPLLHQYRQMKPQIKSVMKFMTNILHDMLHQLIWDRALSLPIERPKSMTFSWIENYCKKKGSKK